MTQDECQRRLGTLGRFVHPYSICTPKLACNIDEGSALTHGGATLYGIASFTASDCSNRFPDLYVQANRFETWISSIISTEK